jgi:hypothetical protein
MNIAKTDDRQRQGATTETSHADPAVLIQAPRMSLVSARKTLG